MTSDGNASAAAEMLWDTLADLIVEQAERYGARPAALFGPVILGFLRCAGPSAGDQRLRRAIASVTVKLVLKTKFYVEMNT